MLKAVEDISTTKKRLTIEIPADAIEREIQDSLEKVRRTTTIPGFRTGKAPMTLIEKKFGKKVEEEVLDRIIPQEYIEAVNKADITPVTDPELEEKVDFKRHQPVSMTLTVEIMPKIDNLNYEKIKIKEIAVAVSDGDVESVLKKSQEDRATYEPSEGPIDMNDLISFDYTVREDGTEVKDQVFKVGGSLFPEEFSRQLAGKKKGDEPNIETTFPDDHVLEKFAGKHLTLNVAVKDIKKVNLPDLDDEFAVDMGFDNLDALKNHIREEILKAKRNEVAKIQKAEILKKLLDSHELDLPESMLESEMNALASGGAADRGQGTGDSKVTDEEKVKEALRQHAVRNVKGSLLLTAIGKKEKVSVDDDDMKSVILSMSQRFGVSPEQLMKFYISRDGSLNGLKNSIFEEKVLDLILSKADVEKGE